MVAQSPVPARPLLLHVFSSFAVGGAQVRFAAVVNRFPNRWRHAIVAMDGNTACRALLSPELDVSFPEVDIRKGDTLGNVRRFRAAIRRLRPELLVTGNFGTIEWAMANLFAPLVRHVHIEDGFGPEERERQLPRRVWLRRICLRRSTVVVPSRVLLDSALRLWRLPERRVRYVPNGVDLARFAPVLRSPAEQNAAGRPLVGSVAALRAEKNLGRLLRAFALAAADTPGSLVIVGDGPERAGLEQLAGELGIAGRVRFTGHIGAPDRMYRMFDIFALSSDTEQMPLSVLEAMAGGLPVVATDVGDIRAMVAPAGGAFLVPRDDDALAAALRRMMRDGGLRQALGEANRARAVRDYDQEAMFSAYASIFDDIY